MMAGPGTSLRVDAHHHVWRLDRGDYGWLTPALATIYRDFGLTDMEPLLASAGIHATVLVQARATVSSAESSAGSISLRAMPCRRLPASRTKRR
jgi:predicted TIM-barrel fold metal-dependent hydrolase